MAKDNNSALIKELEKSLEAFNYNKRLDKYDPNEDMEIILRQEFNEEEQAVISKYYSELSYSMYYTLDAELEFLSKHIGISKEKLSHMPLAKLEALVKDFNNQLKNAKRVPLPNNFNSDKANNLFKRMRVGALTNNIIRTRTDKKNKGMLDMDKMLIIKEPNYNIFISEFEKLKGGLRDTGKILLDTLVMSLTESGKDDTMVMLPLDEYMSLRNLRNKKEARKQIKADLEAISNLTMKFREKKNKKYGDWLDIEISGGTKGIKNNIIFFRFNQECYNHLKLYSAVSFPKEMLSFDVRKNPHSYYLLRRITQHKHMNINGKNADIIRVKTLLKECPHLPTYEEVMEKSKKVTQLIINPFERDMANIDCFNWHYCDINGTSLKQEEPYKDYQEFANCLILITWKDYPNTKQLSS